MENVLLIDYGSTFTKVTAAEISQPRLLGTSSSFTTVATDVNEGLENALSELRKQTGDISFSKRLACSSAAGGLKMVACGLVPELTAKAASLASMGAGAKIIGLYSYELTEDDADEIAGKNPDILLLTGGTDGGNKKCLLHNAEMIANIPGDFPVIIAGNRNCGREAMKILANRQAYLCENVMPAIGKLNIEPARELIRDIFMKKIIHAKGLCDEVIMPTPTAVLTATEMYAHKTGGDLIALDVGGATTDVYSIGNGMTGGVNTIYRGLPEPYSKRTVEGDIGMRYSAAGIACKDGFIRIVELAGINKEKHEEALNYIEHLKNNPGHLPQTADQKNFDFALAAIAIDTASQRHAGTIEEVFTSSGRAMIQTGKDLTETKTMILTGGILLNSDRQKELVEFALYNENKPQSLRPKKIKTFVDKNYIMSAMGLLETYAYDAATEIMMSNMIEI